MKKLKLSSAEPVLEIPVSSSLQKISSLKKPLIIPTVQNLTDITPKLRIKFFKIHSNGLPLSPELAKVIKRNAKYLKGTEGYRFKFSPSLSLCKLANQLDITLSRGFSHSGKILELPSSLSSAVAPGKEHTVKFLKNIVKSNLFLKTLKLEFLPLDEDDDIQSKLYAKLLQRIFLLNLSSNSFYGEYWVTKQNEESPLKDFAILKDINTFTNFQDVAFAMKLRECKPEIFHKAFEAVSEVKNLEALKLSMKFSEIDKKGQNLKKTIAKFEKLKSLHLQLTFGGVLTETGKILTSLASFKNLKHVNLELLSGLALDCSEAIKLITSHKSLESLRLTTRDMRFDEYAELFKGIEKMKSLAELSVVQTYLFKQPFVYGPIFKTLEALKKLKSFTLDLDITDVMERTPMLSLDICSSILH